MIREPGRDYFDEFEAARIDAQMWCSGIRAALGVDSEVTLPEWRRLIETLRASAQPAPPTGVVLALATCLAADVSREALEAAAWMRPWAARICVVDRTSPITRARVTVTAFRDPVDGWGPREGLRALLVWAAAADVQGGPIIALRREIAAALETEPGR